MLETPAAEPLDGRAGLRAVPMILATGSNSFVPPIEGFGLAGTFVLREADDAMQMRAFAQEEGCRRAVIVVGGLLGVEAGYALHKFGLEVLLLERSERLLHRHLDARGSQLLQAYLNGLDIDVVLLEAPASMAAVKQQVDVRPYLDALRAGNWARLLMP